MKGMPLPFDFEGQGVLDLELVVKNRTFFTDNISGKNCFLNNNNNNSFGEPTSVLDSARISSRPTSSSTLSSSLGGGGGGSTGGGGGAASTDTAGVAAVSDRNPSPKWQQDSTTATSASNAGGGPDSELLPIPPSLEIGTTAAAAAAGGNPEKFAMEDWESVLSESVAVSPSQEQSVLRWIMGDVEDPSMGSLNKVLQIGGATAAASTTAEYEFSGGFGVVDQSFNGDQFGSSFMSSFPNINRSTPEKIGLSSNLPNNFKFSPNHQNITHPSPMSNNLGTLSLHHQPTFDSSPEIKPPLFNPQLLINQPPQTPSFFFPLSQEQNIFNPPQAKRHNSGGPDPDQISKGSFMDAGQHQELFMGGRQQFHLHQQQQQQVLPHQLQLLPHYLQQRPPGPGPKPKIGGGDELQHCHQQQQQQQAIVDQLYKAAELVQTGNPVLAQGILARLNHHLSPIGKPFHRAAFYCKEALQSLLQTNSNNNNSNNPHSPFSLIFKIGAYKSFSEISPLIQFANFTCNQALLETLEGFDRIHIVDFDIGYGGQWASFMQELALRNGGAPSLKITALASVGPAQDQLELGLTRENLIQFASEINIAFEFEAMSIESLSSSGSWFQPQENEAVAVNLPVNSLTNHQLSIPFVLRFVKQLSPRIVVSVDRGCDRSDLPFANHVIHALQSYSNLLESLDAVNVNMDALQKIERFLIQPGIEKIVTGRFRLPEKTQHWRAMFLNSGFTPLTFSNFTESQAECVVKRTPVRGFQVEKRQSSLVLCWQRKELVSASAWRC